MEEARHITRGRKKSRERDLQRKVEENGTDEHSKECEKRKEEERKVKNDFIFIWRITIKTKKVELVTIGWMKTIKKSEQSILEKKTSDTIRELKQNDKKKEM